MHVRFIGFIQQNAGLKTGTAENIKSDTELAGLCRSLNEMAQDLSVPLFGNLVEAPTFMWGCASAQ